MGPVTARRAPMRPARGDDRPAGVSTPERAAPDDRAAANAAQRRALESDLAATIRRRGLARCSRSSACEWSVLPDRCVWRLMGKCSGSCVSTPSSADFHLPEGGRAAMTTDGEIAVAAHQQRCTGRWCDGVIFHPPAGGQTAMTTDGEMFRILRQHPEQRRFPSARGWPRGHDN